MDTINNSPSTSSSSSSTAPSTSRSHQHRTRRHTSVSSNMWFILITISFIPGVNYLLWAYYAFFQNKSHSLRNFSRAAMLWSTLFIILLIFLYVYMAPDWNDFVNCWRSASTKDTPPSQLLLPEIPVDTIQ